MTEYEGRIENWQERFPENQIAHYRDGASGGISKGYDTVKNRVVGIKELKGSVDGAKLKLVDNIKTWEDKVRTLEDVINVIGNSQIPGLMKVYGYYEMERRGQKFPQLVFELLPYQSVLDNINGGVPEERVREFIVSNGASIHGLHNANGEPIFHRDIKPANFIEMPEYERWPYVLVDIGNLGIGTRETFQGTHSGTLRYVPLKQLSTGKMNKGTENFALVRSAIHYAIGKRFDEIDLDDFDIRKLQLNYSPELQKVFSSATTQDESRWYHDFGKLMQDLGYKNTKAPQTREELKTLLGHRSLPAEVKTQAPKQVPKTGKGHSVNFDDGTFAFGEMKFGEMKFDLGTNVYETAEKIIEEKSYYETIIDGMHVWSQPKKELYTAFLSYLQHTSTQPGNEAIADALAGRRTLEDAVKEKSPFWLNKITNALDFAASKFMVDASGDIDRRNEDTRQFKQRRQDLYGVFGEKSVKSEQYFGGSLSAGVVLGLAGLAAGAGMDIARGLKDISPAESHWHNKVALIGALVGAIGLPLLLKYNQNSRIRKKARTLDKWIAEAKAYESSQNPQTPKASGKGLEGKVGDIELTGGEIEDIKDKLVDYGAIGGSLIGSFGAGFLSSIIEPPSNIFTDTMLGSLIGAFVGPLFAFTKFSSPLKNYLTNRKLKQKYLTAGLDKEGMRNFGTFELVNHNDIHLAEFELKDFGLKKKPFRSWTPHNETYIGNGIKVHKKYEAKTNRNGGINLRISAKPGQEHVAEELVTMLDEAGLIRRHPTGETKYYHLKENIINDESYFTLNKRNLKLDLMNDIIERYAKGKYTKYSKKGRRFWK